MTYTEPLLHIERIIIIGLSEWKYDFTNVADAEAGLLAIAGDIVDKEPELDRIEMKVEFTNGDFERCAYSDVAHCQTWLNRFREHEV